MSRKTNLFHTRDNDSNFLTFSNFTEALTGSFLSTDWKVYPSRFLCLYIPLLNDEIERQEFVTNYLVRYYENKLAFLRDYYTQQLNDISQVTQYDIEGDVNSFAWLIETLNRYIDDKNTYAFEELIEDKLDDLNAEKLIQLNEAKLAALNQSKLDEINSGLSESQQLSELPPEEVITELPPEEVITVVPNEELITELTEEQLADLMGEFENSDLKIGYEINFIGEVTEFDYKGTYTDSICIIDASEGYINNSNDLATYKIDVTSKKNITYDKDTSILYGWQSDELVDTEYENLTVTLDNEVDETYSIYSEYDLTKETSDRNELTFNVIIPLFDITNINALTNFNSVDETFTKEENLEYKNYNYNEETGELEKVNVDLSSKEVRSVNNPMGIWFAGEDIKLKRDKESKYAPSWSLTISSQFKPFPYSNAYLNNDITSKDNQQAFQTYAQILSQQMSLSNDNSNLSTRITKLEQLVSRLNDLNNNEKLERVLQLERLTNQLQETLNSLTAVIDEKVAAAVANNVYKWKN